MSGYAVRNDFQGWRAVDGAEPDLNDQSKTYPDPSAEHYSEDAPSQPVPSGVELISAALHKRDELLSLATIRISPLQDAVDLEDATDSDVDALRKLKQYRVALNRIEQQSTFPNEISWPVLSV